MSEMRKFMDVDQAPGKSSADPADAGEADAHAQAIEAAAEELAAGLKTLADRLATHITPQRVRYGPGRLGNALRRRSPEGFVIDTANLQVLLPDGRLWSYSRSDAERYPAGRYFDVRTDYRRFAGGHSHFGGTGFTFLGAVLGTYTFGLADRDGRAEGTEGLCALCGEGRSIHYVDTATAFADIADRFTAGT